jgi:hypothetical protein
MTTPIVDHESETIALNFSCSQLKRAENSDRGTVVVQLRSLVSSATDEWHILGRTEAVTIAPTVDFTTSIEMSFVFETRQRLKAELIEVVDTPDARSNQADGLTRQGTINNQQGFARTHTGVSGTKLGEVVFDLADIAGALDNSKTVHLKSVVGQTVGTCAIKLEKSDVKEKSQHTFDIVVLNVPKFHMFSSQNTYVKIFKQRLPDAQLKRMSELDKNPSQIKNFEWILVEKTTPIKGENVRFTQISIAGSKLCYNNRQIMIKFELWKAKKNGKDYLLGKTHLTLNDITLKSGTRFPITLAEKVNANTGIRFESFRSERIYDFVDFIQAGISMSFVVGIDFTLSNKDPRDPASLHFFDGRNLNLYQKAILAVGEIMEKYNHTKHIAAYGFGAKLRPTEPANHFFPINLNYSNPFFRYFREMLEAYCALLPQLTLSGPTNFAPLLKNVLKFAETKFAEDPFNYTVLLLLTDGEVTDFQDSIDAIIEGCNLPLSVIIVGVGNESFEKMDQLDGNETPLVSSEGFKMQRDIVRFVAFNSLSNNPILLREEVLRELPEQVVGFYRMRGIPPRNPDEAKLLRKRASARSISEKDSESNSSMQSIDQILEQGLLKNLAALKK